MGKKKRRGGKNLVGTAFKFIRLAALIGPGAAQVMKPTTPNEKIREVLAVYTGYDIDTGLFHPELLAQGWGPYLMAVLATYGIPKISGIIRKL